MTTNSKIIENICFVNTGFDSSADRVTKANIKKSYEIIPAGMKLNDGIFILKEDEYIKIKPEDDLVYKCYKSSDIDKYSSTKWQKIYVIWINRDVYINKYDNALKNPDNFLTEFIST